MKRLFVIIMPIGRENINMDFCFENAINKSMLLCDFTAPSTFGLSFQRSPINLRAFLYALGS